MTDREVLESLVLLDKAPKSADQLTALRATLVRMVQANEIERVSPGVYRLAPQQPAIEVREAVASNGDASHSITATWRGES